MVFDSADMGSFRSSLVKGEEKAQSNHEVLSPIQAPGLVSDPVVEYKVTDILRNTT